MSDTYMFGFGGGYLKRREVERVLRENGFDDIELAQMTDAPCRCGYGCEPYTCPSTRKHWFEMENYGTYSRDRADDAIGALDRAGVFTPKGFDPKPENYDSDKFE